MQEKSHSPIRNFLASAIPAMFLIFFVCPLTVTSVLSMLIFFKLTGKRSMSV